MKRLFCLLLCVLMVFGAIGCASTGEPAEPEGEALFAPGTYTGYGQGFYLGEPIKVDVTVDENSIVDIKVDMENGETPTILQAAIDKIVPRILEHQSVYVDTITGATASSAGIRLAVINALNKALEAAGTDPSAISAFQTIPEKVTGVTETIHTGVLVVGMGGSGTAAAVRAAEIMHEADPDNVRVLAIDKAGKYGGTSSLTTEMFAINPPRFQEEHNAGKDYVDKAGMRKSWLEYTEGDEKTEMVDILLDNSGKALDWLVYEHGFKFDTPKRGFTEEDIYEVKYQYLPNDRGNNKDVIGQYYDRIYADYTALGGEYMLETEAYELIYDEATNTVKGVKARGYDGTEYEIYADAVILATGGFAGNGDMMTKYLTNEYYPLKGAWKVYGSLQNDGKMIESAIQIGAGTYNISVCPIVHMSGTPSFLTQFEKREVPGEKGFFTGRPAVWSPGDIPLNMVVSGDSLAVGRDGKRFASELNLMMLDPWKAGPYFYSIWSNDQIQRIKEEGFTAEWVGLPVGLEFLGHQYPIPRNTPLPEVEEVLEAAIEQGFAYKADTLEELAEMLEIDPAVLTETVAKYNSYCDAGEDPEFGKPADYLVKIGSGPYYAVVGAPYCYSTCGGLDVDTNFNVLKADGRTPINGLYAVGTDCIGVLFTEKKPYVTYGGVAQGWAYTSGYLCGEIAAKQVLGN
ncbi:MAG: FAD-binding protein [bacterium]